MKKSEQLLKLSDLPTGGRNRQLINQLLHDFQTKAAALAIVADILREHDAAKAQETGPAKLQAALDYRASIEASQPDIVMEPVKTRKKYTKRAKVKQLLNGRGRGAPRKATNALSRQQQMRRMKLKQGDRLVGKGMVLFVAEHLAEARPHQLKQLVVEARALGYAVRRNSGLAFVSALTNGLTRQGFARKEPEGYYLTSGGTAYARQLRVELEERGDIAPGSYTRVAPIPRRTEQSEGQTAH